MPVHTEYSVVGLPLNAAPAMTMHVDINSCFATLEQQANPLLRGVPVAVAAYAQPFGCILAASREAKMWGVTTGMRVREGKELCPFLVVMEGDPNKYRFIHGRLKEILSSYSDRVSPKSIDEFVTDLSHTPSRHDLPRLSSEIKQRIRCEVGEWITVSIGVGPNRFLAKLGADIDKPDGFQVIDHRNLVDVYGRIDLTTFCGINTRYEKRLHEQGIFTPLQFLNADITTLRAAFRSVVSRDWYLRLRGYEVDDFNFTRRSYGQSYVLPRPSPESVWRPILAKLVDKATRRMRQDGYACKGVWLYLNFGALGGWHTSHIGKSAVFASPDCYQRALSLQDRCPVNYPVKQIAVSFAELEPLAILQLSLTDNIPRQRDLYRAVDAVNDRYGTYTLHPASMLGTATYVPDRIAFGTPR